MTTLAELSHTNHDEPYSEEYLQTILTSVKTIAMVGASRTRPSSAMAFCGSCTRQVMTWCRSIRARAWMKFAGSRFTPHLPMWTGRLIWLKSFAAPRIYPQLPRKRLPWVPRCCGADWCEASGSGKNCRGCRHESGDGSLPENRTVQALLETETASGNLSVIRHPFPASRHLCLF